MTQQRTPDSLDADTTAPQEHRRSQPPVDPALGAAVGGALGAGLLVWLFAKLFRRRQQPQTPQEKLVQAGHDATTVVGHQARRWAAEAADAAQRTAAVATPVVLTGAGVLAQESRRAAARVAEAGSHAASAGAHARDEVVDTFEHAQRKVSRFFLKLLAALAFGGGYVLGAQAGRERYEQIVRAAEQVRSRVNG